MSRAGRRPDRAAAWAAVLAAAVLGSGCVTPSPPPPVPGLVELLERPAERALSEGIRAYDDGQYAQAEKRLREAIAAPLSNRRDLATAWKLLAFMHCAAGREADCEAAFRTALGADPGLELSRPEAGHPMWGPVWRRVRPATR
jgi:Tfp pilus assembly protein PilF